MVMPGTVLHQRFINIVSASIAILLQVFFSVKRFVCRCVDEEW